MGLVRSFQISAVFPHLTVLENVRIALQRSAGHSFDFWRSERALDALDDRALRAARRRRPRRVRARRTPCELPYGRKRALEIATTLALDPEMMLLDEPTAGMAHEDVERIAALIQQGRGEPHRADGRAQPVGGVDAVRPHHRAGARRGAGRGRLRGRVEASRGDRGLHGSRSMPDDARRTAGAAHGAARRCSRCATCNAWYGESHILHGVDFDVRRGRGGDAARPQRRRQDDDAEVDHGHRAAARGLDRVRGQRDDRARRRTGSRGSASPTAPRSAASSRASTSRRTCCCRRWCARAACARADLRAVPEPEGAAARARARSSRAASSRCWRSAASCAPARGCCCSTSRPRAWRR